MSRNGWTLINVLVIISFVVILVVLIGSLGVIWTAKDPETGFRYYDVEKTGIYRCVKTYTVHTEQFTAKRVDLRPAEGGEVQTFVCNDDFMAGIYDSGVIFAQFESGNWYKVTSVGFRRVGMYSFFPLVKNVQEIPPPE